VRIRVVAFLVAILVAACGGTAGYQLWTSIIQPRLATDLGF